MASYAKENSAISPHLDLNSIKYVFNYNNSNISNIILKHFCSHLWYLSKEPLGFAFFNNNILVDLKNITAQVLIYNNGSDEIIKKLSIKPHKVTSIVTKDLSNFINANSSVFFKSFGIDTSFLLNEPDKWNNNITYKVGASIVPYKYIVNDIAERCVKLIEEYNSILIKDEKQKKCILQIVKVNKNK